MSTTFIIAQLCSAMGGIAIVKAMHSKEKSRFLKFNCISNAFGVAAMTLLQAYSGAIGPIVATIQALVTYKYEQKGKQQPKVLCGLYLLLNILGGALTVNSLLSVIPVVSSCLACTMMMTKKVSTSRKINIVGSLMSIPYLIMVQAYVAAINFTASFISTIDAMIRYDRKEKKEEIVVKQEVVEQPVESKENEKDIILEQPVELNEIINNIEPTEEKQKVLVKKLDRRI